MRPNFASSLTSKTVMDSEGRSIGECYDIQFHSQTGTLEELIVSKTTETNQDLAHIYDTDAQGRYIIPTNLIQSVDDCIIVSAE